ncbi:MAG: MTAP family purine nucleoside phosphorylase [Candidatus Caldarchaeum sp.]|nr:MTAP family purine nucleoside phosphorylase [Candidatus Caldarchaeum sp.]
MHQLGFIGGVEKSILTAEIREKLSPAKRIKTPYGLTSPLKFLAHSGKKYVLIFRHGLEKIEITAPFVNYRANIYALKKMGVSRIVSFNTVGSLTQEVRVGDLILCDDFIDLADHMRRTFFTAKKSRHIRMHPAFCPDLMSRLAKVSSFLGKRLKQGGVYVCVNGPRLETAAEIRYLRIIGGDMVGMTMATEANLARELDMCYAPVCYSIDYAEGVYKAPDGSNVLVPEDEKQLKNEVSTVFSKVLEGILESSDAPKACGCELYGYLTIEPKLKPVVKMARNKSAVGK